MFGGVMTAGLAADGANTLVIEDRSEARLRATDQQSAPGTSSPAFDFTTTPSIRLQIVGRRLDWGVGGSYTFTAANIGQSDGAGVTNFGTGTTALGWHDRHLRLRIEEDGSYGSVNFAYLTPTTPAALIARVPGMAAPTVSTAFTRFTARTIDYFSSDSTLAITWTVDRRWIWNLTGGYMASGGANFQSRNLTEGGVASQRLGHGLTTLTYRFDKQNDGILSLGGRHNDTSVVADFGPLPAAGITPDAPPSAGIAAPIPLAFEGLSTDEGDASLTWRRTWSRQIDSTLQGGASVIHQRLPDTGWKPVPTGEAVLSEKFGRGGLTGTATEAVYLIPTFDFITGSVTVPITASVTSTILEHKRTYNAEVGFTKTTGLLRSGPITTATGGFNGTTLPVVTPDYLVIDGGASVTQALSHRFDVAGGFRISWQQTEGAQQAPPFTSGTVFVAFVYHEPPIHF
jgi:hypothetical protein